MHGHMNVKFTQLVGLSDQGDEMGGACGVHRKEEKRV
jgi:hypothetical protein